MITPTTTASPTGARRNRRSDPLTEAPGITGHWDIDPAHSRLGFSTRHAMVSRVRGAFNEVSGSADIAEDLLGLDRHGHRQRPRASTPAARTRDNHLRSADFFDVETYPEIRFNSSAIDEVDEGSFIVTGELTIRNMTKTVSVPARAHRRRHRPVRKPARQPRGLPPHRPQGLGRDLEYEARFRWRTRQ